MVVRDLFGESPEDYHSLDDFVKRAAALKLSRKVLEQVCPLRRCAQSNVSRDSAFDSPIFPSVFCRSIFAKFGMSLRC